jgi:dihydropyrimidinase
MVHAENHEMIQWLTRRLLERGHAAPKHHMTAHHPLAEAEATHRVVALSRLLDVPVLIVHVSGGEAAKTIRAAQTLGARVFAETCPQYLFLEGSDADKPGLEGAKWCCSPPPRDKASQEMVWQGLKDGTFQVLSSDHAPFRFDDPQGKKPGGAEVPFRHIPNGIPGLETRLPLLYSEGVLGGRITLQKFVELTATNPAKAYGLHPRKGTIAVGSDADLVLWDEREVTIRNDRLHHAVDYTPYEGMQLKAWPAMTLSRGEVVWDGKVFTGQAGRGKFLPCGTPTLLPRRRA